MNRALLRTLGFVRGATHAEFIRSADGEFYFLEVAGRVGGAFISDSLEAATGVNVWREWANLEIGRGEVPYDLPPQRADYAGVVLALARQEWPDTSAYADPEVVLRPAKRHHAALVVASHDYDRVQHLLGEYCTAVRGGFPRRAAADGTPAGVEPRWDSAELPSGQRFQNLPTNQVEEGGTMTVPLVAHGWR